MTRQHLLALTLLSSLLAACPAGNADGPGSAPTCEAYLECLAATDVDMFEDESAVYGRNGTCLQQSDATTCDTACRQRLEEIETDDAACQPPAEQETDTAASDDPIANEDGSIDCSQIGPGGTTVGGGQTGLTGFPKVWCSPRVAGAGSSTDYTCCSDDPAAEMGGLPAYQGKAIDGTTPIFSGANNELGTSGMCVRTDDIPGGSGLAEPASADCPVPCNPTWNADDVSTVCGFGRLCCQTRELQPEDCILDGDTWRPVSGEDIPAFSDWGPASHATHQDPGGSGCITFAGGSSGEAFNDCVRELSVADQRGYCMALDACPLDAPGYLDACTRINMGLIPPPQ